MKTLYETSDWGWDEAAKQEQLFEDEARYILAVDSSPHIVGFLHFRFVIENDQAVIYCYEIQVESQHRGQGLGQHLMHIMELIGTEWKMKKAMLTVFKHNKRALHFYLQRINYIMDEEMNDNEDDSCCWVLSKTLEKITIN
eukprot:Sdes_comp18211_c0_seq3m7778